MEAKAEFFLQKKMGNGAKCVRDGSGYERRFWRLEFST